MSARPKVAFSKDFLASYSALPKKIQKKVREFTEKFQQDPTQSGLNFERLEAAADEKVRSLRIDQAYRVIVIHPPKGDVYLCVWVDHHDEAYQWVRRKRFEVNPTSGVFQLFELDDGAAVTGAAPVAEAEGGVGAAGKGEAEGGADVAGQGEVGGTGDAGAEGRGGADLEDGVEAPAGSTPRDQAAVGLFARFDEEDLVLAGVPIALLPAVQAVRDEAALDQLSPHLPEDAAEMLYALATGYTLEEALTEVERPRAPAAKVDPQDFAAALAEPASQRQFKVLEDEQDLQAMLDAPLEQWRIFLHPTQRKLVERNANGPVRVLGGAGTGKTVVLMHRARYLARSVFNDPADRILVTTFTRNLALDLQQHLQGLCGAELERLEVVNLHRWAVQFLRRQGVEVNILQRDGERQSLMDAAVDEFGDQGYPREFFLEEWDAVVQAQEVLTKEDYFQARRVGRGTRMSRRQRAAVWQVFARYRQSLEEAGQVEWQDVIREARLLLRQRSIPLPYRALCADEVQDFTPSELKLLRAIVPEGANDLFLVGDGHQRIYGQPTSLSRCGIQIRGRSRRLKLNYRTTDRIAKHALAILKDCDIDDLDEGRDTLKGYTSLRKGAEPEVQTFDTEAQESAFIISKLRAWLDQGTPPSEICLAARTQRLVRDRYQKLLEAEGLPCAVVEADTEPGEEHPGIRLATMHRMKGLEFPKVLLASVHDGVVPSLGETASTEDRTVREQRLLQERCLFYVACTRARDELVVTGYGGRSVLL